MADSRGGTGSTSGRKEAGGDQNGYGGSMLDVGHNSFVSPIEIPRDNDAPEFEPGPAGPDPAGSYEKLVD